MSEPATPAEPVTPQTVAEWMAEQVEAQGELHQQAAAHAIQQRFGDAFVCPDANGDLGIERKVLYRFKKITGASVVWVAVPGNWLAGYWRGRQPDDGEGRRQSRW